MTAMELEVQKASLAREVLNTDNSELLDRLLKVCKQFKKRTVNEEETISKEEILAGIDAGLKDIKAGRTRPARELLNEL